MSDRKIGVYICHCGGNISDYVDVEKVREVVQGEPGVVVAKTAMFTCSDATQQEMVQDIQEQNLDGLVVASCSPKLHLFTFREVAKRAGLNPYQYTQVNIREQCSWTHTDDKPGATEKAIRLIRGGIARTVLTEPLEPMKLDTVPQVLIVGAGIAGLRAAVGLSDLGISVILIEKSAAPGGRVAGLGKMYPHGKNGQKIIGQLVDEVKKRKNITLFTGAELVGKAGSIGNFTAKIQIKGKKVETVETIEARVGSIIVATGFEDYQPADGEFGYGIDGVMTLAEYKAVLDNSGGKLVKDGREIKNVVYVYCVGSRQQSGEDPNKYCSRYCCNAAVHAAIESADIDQGIHQFHLFRDMRTYGKFEALYTEARDKGSVFIRYSNAEPPKVEKDAGGRLKITVKDLLTFGEEIVIPADLVVLVTGMVPRSNNALVDVLKLPVGRDKFFNEIHPKLRPVETVVDGVFICGTCQGPKNSAESVASALSAVTQSASILKKGYVELEPLIAAIDPDKCRICDVCVGACPYSAIEKGRHQGKAVAVVNEAVCKGCGGCAPMCPAGAINLKGFTDDQMESLIDAMLKEIV